MMCQQQDYFKITWENILFKNSIRKTVTVTCFSNLPPFPLNRKERIRDSGMSQIVRNAKEMSKKKKESTLAYHILTAEYYCKHARFMIPSTNKFLFWKKDKSAQNALSLCERSKKVPQEPTLNYRLQSFFFCCYKCYVNGKDTFTGQKEEILKSTIKCIWWINMSIISWDHSWMIRYRYNTDNRSKNVCLATATVAFEILPKLSAQLWHGFRFVSDLLLMNKWSLNI